MRLFIKIVETVKKVSILEVTNDYPSIERAINGSKAVMVPEQEQIAEYEDIDYADWGNYVQVEIYKIKDNITDLIDDLTNYANALPTSIFIAKYCEPEQLNPQFKEEV